MTAERPDRAAEIKKARGIAHALEDKASEYERGYQYNLADLANEAAAMIRRLIGKENPHAVLDDIDGRRYCPLCKAEIIMQGDYCMWCGQRIE